MYLGYHVWIDAGYIKYLRGRIIKGGSKEQKKNMGIVLGKDGYKR